MTIPFYKYQGTGNDFVVIDNRQNLISKNDTEKIRQVCDRRFGIGADGLMFLENDPESDFRMVYFNADGNESTMCGNGGRCLVAFAHFLGIMGDTTTFNAIDGLHHASIVDDIVTLQMIDVETVANNESHVFLDTGSPHHVQFEPSIEDFDIQTLGSKIRYGAPYFEEGTNVNFVKKINDTTFRIRTYERGVEGETLSCGTGATAVGIAMHYIGETQHNAVKIHVEGGELEILFDREGDRYVNVFLKGPAKQVFKGELTW